MELAFGFLKGGKGHNVGVTHDCNPPWRQQRHNNGSFSPSPKPKLVTRLWDLDKKANVPSSNAVEMGRLRSLKFGFQHLQR